MKNVQDLLQVGLKYFSVLSIDILSSIDIVPVDGRRYCQRFFRNTLHECVLDHYFKLATLSLNLRKLCNNF